MIPGSTVIKIPRDLKSKVIKIANDLRLAVFKTARDWRSIEENEVNKKYSIALVITGIMTYNGFFSLSYFSLFIYLFILRFYFIYLSIVFVFHYCY